MDSELPPITASTQIESEIHSIIEKALSEIKSNEIKPASPPPPLETVNNKKQDELKKKLQELSPKNIVSPIKENISKSPKSPKKESVNNISPSSRKPHKYRKNITWDTCHSFCADCHICGVTINEYEAYCQHLKGKHYDIDDELEWLTCDVCGKMNAHKSNFISHLASHTGRKPFKCRIVLNSGEYCATEASTRQNLQTHILKVHKLAVKHKLQQKTNKGNKSANSSPDKKKKRKKKKSKKRKYDEIDINMDDMDINNPVYGYTYKPRRSKRRRPNRKLSIDAQKNAPYCHPLEILIAAATYVEMNNISIQNNVEMTSENMKKAAKNWEKILDAKTLENLKNVANQIDDISTTKQITN